MNKYFIYTGNAYPHKNLNRLVDAVSLLNQERKEKIILKIVSARSVFIERLERMVKEKKADEYVKLLGFVSDKELSNLYKNSEAFVYPTLSEGFGLPPMEAMSAGALVAVSDIPVLKEVYEDSAYYFDPLDITSIAKILDFILTISKKEKETKIKYSKEFIKRYSWLQMAKETLKVYSSVV